MQCDLASDTAVRAGGAHFFEIPGPAQPNGFSFDQGAGRAQLDTLTASHAGGIPQRQVLVRHDQRTMASISHVQDSIDDHFVARLDAPVTANAPVRVSGDHRVAEIERQWERVRPLRRLLDAQPIGRLLQLALAAHVAGKAIVHPVRQQEVNDHPAGLQHRFRLCPDHHPVPDRGVTRHDQAPGPLHLNRAYTAYRRLASLRMKTEAGYVNAVGTGYF